MSPPVRSSTDQPSGPYGPGWWKSRVRTWLSRSDRSEREHEYKSENANGKPSRTKRRAAVERTWLQAPGATGAVRQLRGSSADGQSAFSERDASHGRPTRRDSLGAWALSRGPR